MTSSPGFRKARAVMKMACLQGVTSTFMEETFMPFLARAVLAMASFSSGMPVLGV